jgi:FkbM family methyltransferase
VDAFTRLPKGSANAPLWQGLMASMQLMGRRSAAAAAAPAAAGGPATPEAVLDLLPVAAVAIVDVGASSLGQDTEPYAALVRHGRARVTGFEPDAAALAQLHQLNPDRRTHRFLPHVVGNGQPAVFHQMHWSLTSSLLPPARSVLDRFQRLGELVQVKATQPVHTVRLDDVIEPGGMDLLKIDVQGAEGLVFDGAAQRLTECLVVWTEVEFVPLYEGQPVFGDIDAQLRRHGLQFLCFTGLATRCLAGWPAHGVATPRRQQQLWADAIYVPTAERIAALSADAAARLALLAHHVLQAYDLCHAALQRVDVLGGRSLAAQYLAAQQGRP